MKKQLLFLFFIFCCVKVHAQNDVLWQRTSAVSTLNKNTSSSDSGKLYYKLNSDFLKSKLSATTGKTSKTTTLEITIPNSNGVLERFTVWESSNFEPELQAKYPEIRAYEGSGVDDKSAKIHFSLSPLGMQTMVFRANKATEYIEKNQDNKTDYVLFTSATRSEKKLICTTEGTNTNQSSTAKTSKTTSNNKVFKTMRLALSCTGEYAVYFGGTKELALAGMNATMTRVNGVLNKDLAVQLLMINNDAIIYTNAATDPYSDAKAGADGAWNLELQKNLTAVIGNGSYDIGHLFGASGGGGNAGCIGCVCQDPPNVNAIGKGSAYTSPANGRPEGDSFDIDFVIHEMGHQLGAEHSFTFRSDAGAAQVEPGSGSTIMGYAGISQGYDIQSFSDDYFTYGSILQIQNNLAGKTCPISTAVTNNPPIVNAGSDYTIPISTAFVLTGSGSDPDGDTVTYNWEENDNATTTFADKSFAYATKPDGPLFRSVIPGSSTVRYMPSLNFVVLNKLTTTWESVSSIPRLLHFTLTGRDNSATGTPQTYTDDMTVNVVSSAGPFTISSHNSDNISWWQGYNETVTWNVNNTNTLQGSANVNIKLSTDGGLTFPILLAANTTNDGSESILLPASVPSSKNCRILIEPTANIYYAVNSKPFAVGFTSSTVCNSYSFGDSFSIPYRTTFITRTITVPPSNSTITDVNVSVNVTHDRFSDVEIQIVSPQGTAVRLFNRGCSTTSSTLALQFDDAGSAIDCAKITEQIVVPVDFLSAFNGQNSGGAWTLMVRDAVLGSFGTVNSASINICDQTFTLGVPDFENANFAIYPNPNKGSFAVQFESNSNAGIQVFVHDILGQKVYEKTFESTPHFNQDIQLQNVSAGVYLVTVIDGDRRSVKKMIVY